jgi:hypothetical protein
MALKALLAAIAAASIGIGLVLPTPDHMIAWQSDPEPHSQIAQLDVQRH